MNTNRLIKIKDKNKQERQCTYNVPLRCVHVVTTVAVGMQQSILFFFPHSHKRHDFRNQIIEDKIVF